MLPMILRLLALHRKFSFPLRISSVNVTKSTTADLATFTEEIPNGKLPFLCSAGSENVGFVFVTGAVEYEMIFCFCF